MRCRLVRCKRRGHTSRSVFDACLASPTLCPPSTFPWSSIAPAPTPFPYPGLESRADQEPLSDTLILRIAICCLGRRDEGQALAPELDGVHSSPAHRSKCKPKLGLDALRSADSIEGLLSPPWQAEASGGGRTLHRGRGGTIEAAFRDGDMTPDALARPDRIASAACPGRIALIHLSRHESRRRPSRRPTRSRATTICIG